MVTTGQLGKGRKMGSIFDTLTSKNNSVLFSCSVASKSVTPWTAAHQASLSMTNSQSLLKLMSIELVMPSNHLTSSVVPFSSRLQSFPASGSFPMSQFFPSGAQSIGASTSTSVLPMNISMNIPLSTTSTCLIRC